MDLKSILDIPIRGMEAHRFPEKPGPFCMSYGFDPDDLIRSIEQIGLIHPPLVSRNDRGELQIVSGYRRVEALRRLEINEIPARDLTDLDLSPLEQFLTNLHENLTVRVFNPVEKGMILDQLGEWVARDAVVQTYMPLLGLPSHGPTLDLYCRLAGLGGRIKQALAAGEIPVQAAALLLEMEEEAQNALSAWLLDLRFNLNQKKQVIELILDILHNEGESIQGILGQEAVRAICTDPRMNTPQKARAVIRALKNRCLPSLVRAEERFRRRVRALNLPPRVRISAPP
jgi:hypothetical protein